MKTVAFIESNFTGIDAIKKASAQGIKCYLVTSNYQMLKSMLPHDLFEGFQGCAEVVLVKNSDDVIEVTETLRALPCAVSAVVTFSQFRLITTAQVAKNLGLKTTSDSAIATAIDKFALREVMAKAGAPSIRYLKLLASTTAQNVEDSVGLPCIMKPARGHSSLGVCFVQTREELDKAINKFRADLNKGEVIVEEYLEGPLFSLETVTVAPGEHIAWGYTDRVLTNDFIEIGATFPAVVPDEIAGYKLVTAALDAIGFDFGSCHTELIFTSKGPRIVEINPRIGGSGVSRLVERSTEQDVVLDYVNMFLGEQMPQIQSYKRDVTMRSILPEYSGRIIRLPTRDQILKLDGVKDVWFQRKIGDMTDDTRSNFSWLLTVLTEPANGRTSAENAELAIQIISFEIAIQAPQEKLSTCSA